VVEVEDEEFKAAVLERSKELPVVVDFWAAWCQPCRLLGPVLERLAAEAGGRFLLAKVDIDRSPRTATELQVTSIPTVLAFRDGRIVSEFVGVLPEAQLREFLAGLEPTEAERLVREAARGAETGQTAEAVEAKLRRAVELEPRNDSALVALARFLADKGMIDEVAGLLERIGHAAGSAGDETAQEVSRLAARVHLHRRARESRDERELRERLAASPSDAQALYELGCVLADAGKHEEALQALLAAAEADRKLAREKVRETRVHVFYLVGARSELADEYRAKLTSLLY
jgi:putative thioredoxin